MSNDLASNSNAEAEAWVKEVRRILKRMALRLATEASLEEADRADEANLAEGIRQSETLKQEQDQVRFATNQIAIQELTAVASLLTPVTPKFAQLIETYSAAKLVFDSAAAEAEANETYEPFFSDQIAFQKEVETLVGLQPEHDQLVAAKTEIEQWQTTESSKVDDVVKLTSLPSLLLAAQSKLATLYDTLKLQIEQSEYLTAKGLLADVDAHLSLYGDAQVAHAQAKESCDTAWYQNVETILQQARQVPTATGLATEFSELEKAAQASYDEYNKQEYAEAQKLQQAIIDKAQLLIEKNKLKVACDFAWIQNVQPTFSEAQQVPNVPGLNKEIGEFNSACTESNNKYYAGEYVEAQKLHQTIVDKAQLLIEKNKLKIACDNAWNQNVQAIYSEAQQVPNVSGMQKEGGEFVNAFTASNNKYFAGDYAEAQKLQQAIIDKAQLLIEKNKLKIACDNAWNQNVSASYLQARKVGVVPELKTAIEALDLAMKASNDEYNKGAYAEAQKFHPAIVEKAKELIQAGATTMLVARPEIGSTQELLATSKLNLMSTDDQQLVTELIDKAPTEKHKQNLRKAVASGHSAKEISDFAAKIRFKDEKWIQENLHVTVTSSGKGIQQQFKMSCQATMVQAVRAELDPIYALQLHEENFDITQVGKSEQTELAREQKKMLETDWAELNTTYESQAKQRMDNEDPTTKLALEQLLATATTNNEKNQLNYEIGRAEKFSPDVLKAWFDKDVKGKRSSAGVAVHIGNPSPEHGRGRTGVDLLNKNQASTGLKYEQVLVNDSTREAAVNDITAELMLGRPVPLTVGSFEGQTAHYVLALGIVPGNPKSIIIHDPGTGTTVMRTEDQLKNNQMDLPSTWGRLTDYVKPTPI
ncbi:hypothetical protein Psta_0147 [Pirellula staleyi DSM 6068]|uniref:PH domain-containing protein n=1 Tax=Pirellula staleyi (strain ATCC 27377 / DSM 6068 / ICPB 4128) TaxID=530564 RepID=D2R0H5_PIRSD|nr:hypothetical protein [Pirellula staleyi]ADB14843.1 hypothetical protein Psta_0147 [Pirellula staleyi DSM 6068]